MHRIQFQKRKHLVLSMIWYNSLPQFVTIVLDMPLTRLIYRPPSKSNYGLARFKVVASQILEAVAIEAKCLPYYTFKKEYKRLLLDSQWMNFNYYLALSVNFFFYFT